MGVGCELEGERVHVHVELLKRARFVRLVHLVRVAIVSRAIVSRAIVSRAIVSRATVSRATVRIAARTTASKPSPAL